MDRIKPGDLVVCVFSENWPHEKECLPLKSIARGKYYRVERRWQSPRGDCVSLRGVKADTVSGGFCPTRFRKVKPATADFKALLSSLHLLSSGRVGA